MDHPGAASARERWEWRRRIRSDPGRYRVYRVAVALVGVLLVLVGLVLGPFPGPGGIPLVLAGLAILASEFIWARRLLERAKVHVQDFTHWAGRQPAWLRTAGSLALLACVASGAYGGLVLAGAPQWLPGPVLAALVGLPGVEERGGPLG